MRGTPRRPDPLIALEIDVNDGLDGCDTDAGVDLSGTVLP
jgi:hypothetical protein